MHFIISISLVHLIKIPVDRQQVRKKEHNTKDCYCFFAITMKKLLLRAKPAKEEDRSEPYDLQYFEYWDHSDKKWKAHNETSTTLYEQRLPKDGKRGVDIFEKWLKNDEYNEIQLQPLCFSFKHANSESAIVHLEDLIYKKKTNGLALMRQFWKAGLVWNSSVNTRLTWKCDDTDAKQMYTIFEKGQWTTGSDPPDFQPNVDEHKINLKGLNLTGLKLKSKGPEFPRHLNFNYTVCIKCELDGIKKATSFRGAHLREARFCGNSKLRENDLTSTICYKTHFDFPNDEIDKDITKGVKRFKDLCLNEASFIDTAIFKFKKDSDDPTNTGRDGKDEYKINGSFGVWKHLSKSRETLCKHKSELAYVVGEIERLRNYEAKKDNWKEIIDSWIAFDKMPFKTKEAKDMQTFLFKQQDSKDLMVIGTVLYSIDDEPPYGLLTRIKKHVGETLLRNKDYYKNRKNLTDEIENINDILYTKDRMDTTIQNFVLGIFIFFFTIGANIVSDEIQQRILNETGLE